MTPRLTRRTLLATLPLLAGAAMSLKAEAASSIELAPDQTAAVQQVMDYFNSFQTLTGTFSQVGPTGKVSQGVLWLMKPGRMRFEYAPPNPFVVVSDGRWVTIKNQQKNLADQYPLVTTPLRLILAAHLDLFKDTIIRSVQAGEGLITLALQDPNPVVSGQLVLIFDTQRNVLSQWIVIDGAGRRTTVSLDNLQPNQQPDPTLFTVEVDRSRFQSKSR